MSPNSDIVSPFQLADGSGQIAGDSVDRFGTSRMEFSCQLHAANRHLLLRYPVQHLVVRSSERQKPWLPVVQAKRRTGEWNFCERVVGLPVRDPFRHFLSLPGRHRYAMTGVSEGKVDSFNLSRMRHDVEAEIESSTPDVF